MGVSDRPTASRLRRPHADRARCLLPALGHCAMSVDPFSFLVGLILGVAIQALLVPGVIDARNLIDRAFARRRAGYGR